MSHSQWEKKKYKKAASEAKVSKLYSKLVRNIMTEAKLSGGNRDASGLKAAIAKARAVDMPSDNIERAIKKANEQSTQMESITYEAYGPGGVGMIIEALTDNRNKAAQEMRDRVEALVGVEAFRAVAAERALVARLTEVLKSPKEKLEERLTSTIEELKLAQRKLASLQAGQLAIRIPEFVSAAQQLGSTKFIAADLGEVGSVDDLRTLATSIREKVSAENAVAAVFGIIDAKPMLVIATTDSARTSGAKAGALVRAASAVLGGGGGGKDDIAQGGGSDASKITDAIGAVKEALSA